MGSARLERRPWRAMDAAARPPWAARRAAASRRVRRRVAVVAALARRGARGPDPRPPRPDAGHLVDRQRRAARLASYHARRVYRVSLRLGRGPAFGPAHGRRQCHRHACRRSRSLASPRRRCEAVGQDAAHLPGGASAVRPSLRFLALVIVGWAGFRAATSGMLPSPGGMFTQRSEAKIPPPIVQTEFPQVEPVEPATAGYVPTGAATSAPIAPAVTAPTPVAVASVGPAVIRYVQ